MLLLVISKEGSLQPFMLETKVSLIDPTEIL